MLDTVSQTGLLYCMRERLGSLKRVPESLPGDVFRPDAVRESYDR